MTKKLSDLANLKITKLMADNPTEAFKAMLALVKENKRLVNELASITSQFKATTKELKNYKKEQK